MTGVGSGRAKAEPFVLFGFFSPVGAILAKCEANACYEANFGLAALALFCRQFGCFRSWNPEFTISPLRPPKRPFLHSKTLYSKGEYPILTQRYRPENPPEIQKCQKNSAFTRTFSKSLRGPSACFPVKRVRNPTDIAQGTYSDELFILGGI